MGSDAPRRQAMMRLVGRDSGVTLSVTVQADRTIDVRGLLRRRKDGLSYSGMSSLRETSSFLEVLDQCAEIEEDLLCREKSDQDPDAQDKARGKRISILL